MNIIILENIRSAYNVWNIIRTADALSWEVRLVGYTPSPSDTPKVSKTALWADKNVPIRRFDTIQDLRKTIKSENLISIAAELTGDAIHLSKFWKSRKDEWEKPIAIIFWNEVEGVSNTSLDNVDKVVYIPQQWIKASMNIGQSTAIFMWEFVRNRG